VPAKSTVHAVLDRHGLVSRARKRRPAQKARRCRRAWRPTIFGAPTTRASSSSAMAVTATP
jgi:hypothetical protein